MKFAVTTHTIVKNEDQWIWYAINSLINDIDHMFIYDTGSTDSTLKILQHFSGHPKITIQQLPATTRKALVSLRQQQLQNTNTPWFMILDGDEIWPQSNLHQLFTAARIASQRTLGFYTRTRNCVGDIYHYLPESKGRYSIKGITGNLNIRLIRNHHKLKIVGEYPLETYTINGSAIQDIQSRIQFVDTWYLHTTHLRRSTQPAAETKVIDRLKKRKFRLGLSMPKAQLPKVFWQPRPDIVPSPITNRWAELWRNLI